LATGRIRTISSTVHDSLTGDKTPGDRRLVDSKDAIFLARDCREEAPEQSS